MPTISNGMSASPLSTEKIEIFQGETRILSDISIEIPQNKLTVLVGPNGSGKSTLLSGLARLLPTKNGTVYLDGKNIAQYPNREIARILGILPQTQTMPENLSVHDLVSCGRYPHHGMLRRWTLEDEKAVHRALAITDTTEFADRSLSSLSGGQRQRCFIAMILAQETNIILLDEPTTFLDLRYQVEVMELIETLKRDFQRTIVTVLHDLNFAIQYADHMIFLKKGKIHAQCNDPRNCHADLISEVFETSVTRIETGKDALPVFMPLRQNRPSQ